MENTPEGRVVSWLSVIYEDKKMKMKKRERRREKPDCQDFQKHLKEGRRDC